ncbi:holin/antiholin [Caulobacter phage Sansa]|uniref:Holin/antiholin n=1 Tax=Caulobacter phage Sansa TaxID=1675600 RepID=A0A0K1LMN2_9CAUD|nr:holin/antiholin [Caulobacter phage Sansa]AKU43453.1 holin/antiholin [Caulobacter phage Sansa]
MASAAKFMMSMLTGPDGESVAPGRVMACILFIVGQFVTIYVVFKLGPKAIVSDWALALQSLALWEGAICGGATGLILGTAPTDAGGKWWGKDASPPPPPVPPVKEV